MDLVTFLVAARRATYAIPQGEALGDDTEHMAWDHDTWSYRDRYAGRNPYGGQELVWHEGRVVWMMNYLAEVVSERRPMDEIYEFQREVLGQPDPQQLMRGPPHHARGDFVYRNEIEGDLTRFVGRETILHDGVELYRMIFHGGAIGT